jgi:RNA polymerase sigma factor (sigma-70 family)
MAELDSDAPTRASLLLRLRDPRDAEAWRTFVDVYGPLVYSHCRRRGIDHNDAEDVTQKIFAQVMQSIRAFDYQPKVGRFRDWLGTIVRNDISRFFRKRGRDITSRTGDEAAPLEQVAGRGEDTRGTRIFRPTSSALGSLAVSRTSRPIPGERSSWSGSNIKRPPTSPGCSIVRSILCTSPSRGC